MAEQCMVWTCRAEQWEAWHGDTLRWCHEHYLWYLAVVLDDLDREFGLPR